ncbi:MAG TPA: BBE domain-containing protein, partial [Kribbella sp.]
MTINLTVLADPGRRLSAILHGASTSNTESTRDLLENFLAHLDTTARPQLRGGVPYHQLKASFPDPALEDWAGAYHAGNYPRLVAVKQTYDPDRLFDFPQAI